MMRMMVRSSLFPSVFTDSPQTDRLSDRIPVQFVPGGNKLNQTQTAASSIAITSFSKILFTADSFANVVSWCGSVWAMVASMSKWLSLLNFPLHTGPSKLSHWTWNQISKCFAVQVRFPLCCNKFTTFTCTECDKLHLAETLTHIHHEPVPRHTGSRCEHTITS